MAPISQEELDSPPSPRRGRAAGSGTDARPGRPTLRTHGGRRGRRGASHHGPGLGLAARAAEGLGPGGRRRRTRIPAARRREGKEGQGEVSSPERASELLLLPSPPPLLKSKSYNL